MPEKYYLEMALHLLGVAILISACFSLYKKNMKKHFLALLFSIASMETFIASMYLPIELQDMAQFEWVNIFGFLSVVGFLVLALVVLSLVRSSSSQGQTP